MDSIFFLAIVAGFLTILAPCILPLLPFLLGTGGGRSKLRPLMIVAGFVGSFSLIGAALAVFGSLLGISAGALRLVAVVLLLLFGVALLWESLYEKITARLASMLTQWGSRISRGSATRTDAFSGLAVGVSLGLVWTPCAGPILGTILTLASRTDDFVLTALLLFAYALGAGIPMLAIAYGGHALQRRLLAAGTWHRALNKAFGVLIIVMALLLLTGREVQFQTWLIQFYPESFTSKL